MPLIKLDAEGHERFIFAGAVELMERERPILVFEDSPLNPSNATRYLHFERGYCVYGPGPLTRPGTTSFTPTETDFFGFPPPTTVRPRRSAERVQGGSSRGSSCDSTAMGIARRLKWKRWMPAL